MILKDNMELEFARMQQLRLNQESIETDSSSIELLGKVEKAFPSSDSQFLGQAIDFAKGINYKHPGLSPLAYLNHPVRVANFIFSEIEKPNISTLVLAILHNVYEVSDVTSETIEKTFNRELADQIRTLTVDRKQTSRHYKERYYFNISSSHLSVRTVKIFDKFDNLFMICFNPDDEIRKSYIKEISDFILPMAKGDTPRIYDYYCCLVDFMQNFGFIPRPKSNQ